MIIPRWAISNKQVFELMRAQYKITVIELSSQFRLAAALLDYVYLA